METVVRALTAVALALASTMVLGCSEAECEATTELRVTFGSDIAGDDGEVSCDPLPEACGETPTCECLQGQTLESGVNADFCLEEGTCALKEGVLHLTCPGG